MPNRICGCPAYSEHGPDCLDRLFDVDEAAAIFLRRAFQHCDFKVTGDAVDQLVNAFLPALRIMCEKGSMRGDFTWKEAGWRGQLYEAQKKMRRVWACWWRSKPYAYMDDAFDLLNYTGFFIRLARQYKEGEDDGWGTYGLPEGA